MNYLPSIAQAVEQIQNLSLQPLELVDYCLGQIDRFEEQLHGWVLVDRQAARQQAEFLGSLARKHIILGVLHGIPVAIKDIVDVKGLPTKAGSTLRENHVARRDALLVANLRQQGAIILGKTVTTELACFDPSPTKNPWNLAHTPGGSSSGSAAAVAVEMCMAAIGSQTGGSITRPASYCGVCGLKPTFAALSTEGVLPVSSSLDHVGPIARTVSDLSLLWKALSKPLELNRNNKRDGSLSSPPQSRSPIAPRLGILTGYFSTEASDAVRERTDAAVNQLAHAGAKIVSLGIPESFTEVHRMHRRIMAKEAAKKYSKLFKASPSEFGPNVASLLREGLRVTWRQYEEALNHRQQFSVEMFSTLRGIDALATPATNTTAPARLDTTGDPRFNSPWSYCGLPTVCLPCGLADDKMPCGLQLIGHPDREDRLLGVAQWCERELGFKLKPDLLLSPA